METKLQRIIEGPNSKEMEAANLDYLLEIFSCVRKAVGKWKSGFILPPRWGIQSLKAEDYGVINRKENECGWEPRVKEWNFFESTFHKWDSLLTLQTENKTKQKTNEQKNSTYLRDFFHFFQSGYFICAIHKKKLIHYIQ